MRAFHFSEMPYPHVPAEVVARLGSARVVVPNAYCDPVLMADLYSRYLDEYEYADELGLDIMVNEHHQTEICLDVAAPVAASAIVQRTRRARILLLGTPLPHRDSPVRVAEEIAMLDCMSRGRILSGFVRGVPMEIHPANTNPVLTRQRMDEAHDLIVKAWTSPEPFNWEGRFWHFRYVNVWPRAYQSPHPPIWITGSSLGNVPWVAARGYTFACFLTPYEQTEALYGAYRQHCRDRGLAEPGPDRFAFLALCHVADSDAEAMREAEELLSDLRKPRGRFAAPPGYVAPQFLAKAMLPGSGFTSLDSLLARGVEELRRMGILIAGSPRSVIDQITYLFRRCGVGNLLLQQQAGSMPTDVVRRSMRLFATEVYPAVRSLDSAGWSPELRPAASPTFP